MGGMFCPIRAALMGSMKHRIPRRERGLSTWEGGREGGGGSIDGGRCFKQHTGRRMVSPANWEAAGLQRRMERGGWIKSFVLVFCCWFF